MSDGTACGRCGEIEGHGWVEGDCVLRHKNHSTRLIDGGNVCHPCIDRHRDWLAEIVELFGTLHYLLEPMSAVPLSDEKTAWKKKPEGPAPVRLDVLAMLSDRARLFRTGRPSDLPDVPAVMAGWAQALFDARYVAAEAPDTLAGAVAALRADAEGMARLPIVDEYDAELRWVRSHLRRAHGMSNPRPVGRCPSLDGDGNECGGPLWPDQAGRLRVTCTRCDRIYDETMLRHLGGMMEAS